MKKWMKVKTKPFTEFITYCLKHEDKQFELEAHGVGVITTPKQYLKIKTKERKK